MRNFFALFAFCLIVLLCIAGNIQAQGSGAYADVRSTPSRVGNISIRQAEQSAASSYTDGSIEPPQSEMTKAVSAEAMVPDIYKPFKESYYKTVEIVQFSWPQLVSGTHGKFGGRLALGLNRPQYLLPRNLKEIKELGVLGSLDLKIDGVVGGIIESARITLVYDLRQSFKGKDTKISVLIDRVTFKVGIPVGGW